MNLIPYPAEIERADGWLALAEGFRVAATDRALQGQASVLADAITALTGLKPQPAAPDSRAPAMRLVLDRSLPAEACTLRIAADGATVAGRDAEAIARGTATLAQLIRPAAGGARLPCLAIADRPAYPFRALMVDVARCRHGLLTLKQLVVLCWWYKLRYLQLHLTDIQAFTFPSTRYPQLASAHNAFTLDDLRELEAFAVRYGVAIIPELDVPGHANAGLRALCPTQPDNDWNAINPVHPATLGVLDTLIGEMCDVFRASPYFHIGGDEVVYDAWTGCQQCRRHVQTHDLGDLHGLFNRFLVDVHQLVKGHGRRTMVWEGFDPRHRVRLPAEIVVQVFENLYAQPEELVALGHEIVNASWGPLYVVGRLDCPTPMIYQWHPCIFGSHGLGSVPGALDRAPEADRIAEVTAVYPDAIDIRRPPYAKAIPPTDRLLGAALCSWQLPELVEVAHLRRRAAAMGERAWSRRPRGEVAGFLLKLESCDENLQRVLDGMLAKESSLFTVISRAQELAARLQAGQQVGAGPNTLAEIAALAARAGPADGD